MESKNDTHIELSSVQPKNKSFRSIHVQFPPVSDKITTIIPGGEILGPDRKDTEALVDPEDFQRKYSPQQDPIHRLNAAAFTTEMNGLSEELEAIHQTDLITPDKDR